jgi:hypothetical protein
MIGIETSSVLAIIERNYNIVSCFVSGSAVPSPSLEESLLIASLHFKSLRHTTLPHPPKRHTSFFRYISPQEWFGRRHLRHCCPPLVSSSPRLSFFLLSSWSFSEREYQNFFNGYETLNQDQQGRRKVWRANLFLKFQNFMPEYC